MSADVTGAQRPREEEPDAFSPGWVQPAGRDREDALFVLAGSSLGIGRTASTDPPVWIDLALIRNLDALGDPADGSIEVELTLEDGRTVAARWSEQFCDRLVDALMAGASPAPPADPFAPPQPPPVPEAAPPVAAPPVAPAPAPAPFAAPAAPFESTPAVPPAPPADEPAHEPEAAPPGAAAPAGGMFAPGPVPALTGEFLDDDAPGAAPTSVDAVDAAAAPPGPASADLGAADLADGGPAAPVPAFDLGAETVLPEGPLPGEGSLPGLAPTSGASALVLEDVVYLGGYPGQTKKRKKCVATLTAAGIEVEGPSGLSFTVAWDVVRTIEAQNSDEARFRMNTKIHRDATALVVECEQDVTIVLEARDCPTIPLRSAVAQLVADLRVVVV